MSSTLPTHKCNIYAILRLYKCWATFKKMTMKIDRFRLVGFIAIILIAICLIILLIIGLKDSYILWIIPPALCFGLVFYHIQNNYHTKGKRNALIMPLYNLKYGKRFDLIVLLITITVIVILTIIYGFKIGGILGCSVILVNSIAGLIYPYKNGQLIIIDNEGIIAPKIGLQKWININKYYIDKELLTLKLDLNDNSSKIINLNKYIDIDILENELRQKINVAQHVV